MKAKVVEFRDSLDKCLTEIDAIYTDGVVDGFTALHHSQMVVHQTHGNTLGTSL